MSITSLPESLKVDRELADHEWDPNWDEGHDADLRLRPTLELEDLQHWLDLNARQPRRSRRPVSARRRTHSSEITAISTT
jgi:hypothetical protein